MKTTLQLFRVYLLNQRSSFQEGAIRSLFFLLIIYIYSALWSLTSSLNPEFLQRIPWYITVTELIILSNPLIFFDIECDIRTGDLVYSLTRPVNYLFNKLIEHFSAYIFRFIYLAIIGVGLCYLLNPSSLPPLATLLSVLGVSFLAGTVLLIWHAVIGLGAFTFQDCTPLFWLWQRSAFFLGGLMLPLEFYPELLRKIASYTPFEAILNGPAKLMLANSLSTLPIVTLKILIWGVVGTLFARMLFSLNLKKLQINGG